MSELALLNYVVIFLLLLFLFSWLWRYLIIPNYQRQQLRQRLGSEVLGHEAYIKKLYSGLNPKRVWQASSKQQLASGDDLLYGEIDFLAFAEILQELQLEPKAVFYDLGSGAGKAVVTAGLVLPEARAIGIELQLGLCQLALTVQSRCEEELANRISFIEGDLLAHDISDADCVFINATAYRGEFWQSVSQKLLSLNPGCFVLVTTHQLGDGFRLVNSGKRLMSWGMNSLYIYQRV